MTGDVNPVNNEDHLSWRDQILGNLDRSQGVKTLYNAIWAKSEKEDIDALSEWVKSNIVFVC